MDFSLEIGADYGLIFRVFSGGGGDFGVWEWNVALREWRGGETES